MKRATMVQPSSTFVNINKKNLWVSLAIAVLSLCFVPINVSAAVRRHPPQQHHLSRKPSPKLRFGRNGEFKILQVADMHYADGKTTPCEDVLPSQVDGCSDLNTTAFIHRMIEAEKPNFIIFTGDNIYGFDSKDSAKSMDAAFAPAIAARIPWAAVLGNHDQEGTLSREAYMSPPNAQKSSAPGLVYFHIPLPEVASFDSTNFTGVRQEDIGSASVNSGFFTTLVEAGDVKAVFTGHDHVNDFCGQLTGIQLCYGGGFGYHAYGKAGWPRRARVVVASLEKTEEGGWGTVKSIKTWKRLDDKHLTAIDGEVLWSKKHTGTRRKKHINGSPA
uniref:Calcineurin-like phosphoesterase domain-containing protein n=1 Tax=Gossypium raimondii TaxID=29730 RepID=A0A0D2U2D5_GOSRA|nr:hypothetical protein B456_008G132800 [Gossypium raimondii]